MKKSKIKPPPNWEDTPQSFERFESLAKGLMAVPKKELDKALNKHLSHKSHVQGKPRKKATT